MPKKTYSDDLRRQIILDHYENPSNKITSKTKLSSYKKATIQSASCIDNITAYVSITNNNIKDIKFDGLGCAIATSTTDIMAHALKNKSVKEAQEFLINYFNMLENKKYNKAILGDLIVFENVNKQMNRIKCARVGIEAIQQALNKL
jgi:nitrogen fixation NifU-like protein